MKLSRFAEAIAFACLAASAWALCRGHLDSGIVAYFGGCFFFLVANQFDQADALREISRRLGRRRRETVWRVEYRITWPAAPRAVCPLAKPEDQ